MPGSGNLSTGLYPNSSLS